VLHAEAAVIGLAYRRPTQHGILTALLDVKGREFYRKSNRSSVVGIIVGISKTVEGRVRANVIVVISGEVFPFECRPISRNNLIGKVSSVIHEEGENLDVV
jgi:hypothetical protein